MSFIDKIITQKVVNDAKQLYLNGDIEGANQKLIAHERKKLYQNAEGLYLLSKINLEKAVHISDSKELIETFKFYENLLQRAIRAGYSDAKTLYSQYYDGHGNPKILNQKAQNSDSVPDSFPKKEVSDYNIEQCSKDTLDALENYIFDYLADCSGANKGSNLSPDLKCTINKLFPALNTSQIIFYSYTSAPLGNYWYILTPNAYYDVHGTSVFLTDVVKTESYLLDEYRGRRMRFFHKDGIIDECRIRLDHSRMSNVIEKLNNAGPYLTNTGHNYANQKIYDKAYNLYLDSAILFHNSDAQNNVGILYKNGRFVEKDIDKALYWYELAANQNNVYAQANLGTALYNIKQYEKAIPWLHKAADNDNAIAANTLGLCYLNANGTDFNLSLAVRYFKIASDGDNYYGDYNLGRIYTYHDIDYEKALEHHQKAASHNHKGALLSLGLAYTYGKGVEINADKAIEYFDKAISLYDYSYAYANKGYLYATVLNNLEKGMEYFQIAIDKGWTNYSQIARIYMDSDHDRIDYEKAIYWLNKGIESNQAYSSFYLSLLYTEGVGVEKNFDKAYELLSNANDNKEMSILAALGQLYIEGKGVVSNPELGLKYLREALVRNNAYAKYYMGCAYITGNYVKRNVELGIKYLLDLHYLKDSSFTVRGDQKLLDYLSDPKYQIAEKCSSKTIVELCHIFNLHSSPEKLFDLYHRTAQKQETDTCPAEVYALLAKNYHFGIYTEIDYEKAVSYYQKCIYSLDYRYNSEIEFHYASLCFEGKGTPQDFIYGFNMAKAIGAYDSQCPDNSKVYCEGKEKFISLVVQYLKDCKQYQYIHYAASLVDLKKPKYSKLREAITVKRGKTLFEQTMKLVKEYAIKEKEDEETINFILSQGNKSSFDSGAKKAVMKAEKTLRECEIVEKLLHCADLGYFPAIEYLEEHYFDEPTYLDADTRNTYLFRLMKYHSDEGIFKQASALCNQQEDSDPKTILWKLRELIVSRNRAGELFTKALDLAFSELARYIGTNKAEDILDEAYIYVLQSFYFTSVHFQKKYKQLAFVFFSF